jgi:DNA-binding response OmpR family regulator
VTLAETLRALLPNAAILMMSGRIDGLSENTLEALGITVFVNKPVPLVPLRAAVLKLVEKSRGGAEAPQQKGWLAGGLGSRR